MDVVVEAGLPARIASGHGVLITEDEFFAIWDTIVRLSPRPDFATFVGRGLANGAASPVFFAFSCAPDLQTGFERFARFKHVFGPLGMSVRTDASGMTIRLVPLRPDGDPSIAYVCERLSKSRSGLMRELQAADVTFQGILNETRRTMALS